MKDKELDDGFFWFAKASWLYTRPMPWWHFSARIIPNWLRFRQLMKQDWSNPGEEK